MGINTIVTRASCKESGAFVCSMSRDTTRFSVNVGISESPNVSVRINAVTVDGIQMDDQRRSKAGVPVDDATNCVSSKEIPDRRQ